MNLVPLIELAINDHLADRKFHIIEGITESSKYVRFNGQYISLIFETDLILEKVVCYVCEKSVEMTEISERKVPVERFADFFDQFSSTLFIEEHDNFQRVSIIFRYLVDYCIPFIDGKADIDRVVEFYRGFLHAQTYQSMGL